jgi:hypothetical protein
VESFLNEVLPHFKNLENLSFIGCENGELIVSVLFDLIKEQPQTL